MNVSLSNVWFIQRCTKYLRFAVHSSANDCQTTQISCLPTRQRRSKTVQAADRWELPCYTISLSEFTCVMLLFRRTGKIAPAARCDKVPSRTGRLFGAVWRRHRIAGQVLRVLIAQLVVAVIREAGHHGVVPPAHRELGHLHAGACSESVTAEFLLVRISRCIATTDGTCGASHGCP